jgi:acyl transferase domain-containing protein
LNQVSESDIAIIGMAGRFAQARDLGAFWRNLRDGVEALSTLTDAEVASVGLSPAIIGDPHYVRTASVLEDVEMFAASFFDYLPREADLIDPQQRFFLECAWEALEDAGYDSDRYSGVIGVYAGASLSTYLLNIFANPEATRLMSRFQIMIGNDKDHLATRVSYKLNLKGPSLSVQTTCSTSLVAVHLACQSLLYGECDLALAGGVSIKVPQKTGYLHQEGGISSPDGHCRAFDAQAQGTIGGNGVGVVVLKRLADALEDGDFISGIIKGSAINNDGSLKVGYTAPSIEGQAAVIKEALAVADVEPEGITYVETHGTGTTLGDPIEIAALTKAYRATTLEKQFCAVGSVKTNLGHLDAAAGVTGLIKTVLALKHEMIPPSLHFERPNPKIDFQNSPFFVNATLRPWERTNVPRRAGVSSFGIGGTNAHVIVEEAPATQASGDSRAVQLLLLSAKTQTALESATANLAAHLEQHTEADLADVAYTLQVGRRAFKHRRIIVCRERVETVAALRGRDAAQVSTNLCELRARSIAFCFPGQGTQYVNMGLELYRNEPVFSEQVDRCAEILRPHLGLDVRTGLYPATGATEAAQQRLTQTDLAQTSLFVIEYALARLWMEWGVRPAAMIGHSIGEYVAACLSGVFSLEEALALVASRGRLMQALPAGAMLTVALGEKEVESRLTGDLSLAVVNGPQLCVVAGPAAAVSELEARLNEQGGIFCRRLQTSHAFHSKMMEPMLEQFKAAVGRVKLNAPSIPYLSNVSGKWITASEATDATYWVRHLRQTVRFSDGLGLLLEETERILLEVGPGQSLSALARQHPQRAAGQSVVNSLPPAQVKKSGQEHLLKAVGQLWLEGIHLDWTSFYARERRQRMPLPTYPFERQRHWIGTSETRRESALAAITAPTVASAQHEDSHHTHFVQPEENPAGRLLPMTAQAEAAPPLGSAQAVAASNGHDGKPAGRASGERIIAQQLQLMSHQLEVLHQAERTRKARSL